MTGKGGKWEGVPRRLSTALQPKHISENLECMSVADRRIKQNKTEKNKTKSAGACQEISQRTNVNGHGITPDAGKHGQRWLNAPAWPLCPRPLTSGGHDGEKTKSTGAATVQQISVRLVLFEPKSGERAVAVTGWGMYTVRYA